MDSHSPSNGFPYKNLRISTFSYRWFIQISYSTVSEHRHFANITTSAGCSGMEMEQKKDWTWKLSHSEKKDLPRKQHLVIFVPILALYVLSGSMTKNVLFIQLLFVSSSSTVQLLHVISLVLSCSLWEIKLWYLLPTYILPLSHIPWT